MILLPEISFIMLVYILCKIYSLYYNVVSANKGSGWQEIANNFEFLNQSENSLTTENL